MKAHLDCDDLKSRVIGEGDLQQQIVPTARKNVLIGELEGEVCHVFSRLKYRVLCSTEFYGPRRSCTRGRGSCNKAGHQHMTPHRLRKKLPQPAAEGRRTSLAAMLPVRPFPTF